MSGYDDGGDGVYGMMGVSDTITGIFQKLHQKKNTLLSTIPKFTHKEKITTSFCKDFSMKIKHHSIRNTILPSSFRDFSLKSLSANFEKSSQINHFHILSLGLKSLMVMIWIYILINLKELIYLYFDSLFWYYPDSSSGIIQIPHLNNLFSYNLPFSYIYKI